MTYLKFWSKEEFGGYKKKLELLMDELKNILLQGLQYVDGDKIKGIERQINAFLFYEVIYWKQRSRAN